MFTELIIEPESEEEWHEVERELYRRGCSWPSAVGPDGGDLGLDTPAEQLEGDYCHGPFVGRQIFITKMPESNRLAHGYYSNREDADAPIVSGENFLRYAETITEMHRL